MERSDSRLPMLKKFIPLFVMLVALVPSTGCLHLLIASGIYIWEGGNLVNAECAALENKRVVVICQPPASHEFRNAGAARDIARNLGQLLRKNVPGIDVVNSREVDEWLDESDWDEYLELGRAVNADIVLHIDIEHFSLHKGKTLYQGNADIMINVYDLNNNDHTVWYRHLGEVLFPVHSGIPISDKPIRQFQSEFSTIVAERIGVYFYSHDPNASFAQDAAAIH